MRFMVIVKGNADYEAGRMPTEAELTAMGRFNEELVKAGVMLAGEGLRPSADGAILRFGEGGKRTVIDGPFAEARELVGGFWILQTKSKEEVIEWMKRAPFGPGEEIEIRRVAETEDFGDEFTPELREAEERMRAASGMAEKKD